MKQANPNDAATANSTDTNKIAIGTAPSGSQPSKPESSAKTTPANSAGTNTTAIVNSSNGTQPSSTTTPNLATEVKAASASTSNTAAVDPSSSLQPSKTENSASATPAAATVSSAEEVKNEASEKPVIDFKLEAKNKSLIENLKKDNHAQVRHLLEYKADVNTQDTDGASLLVIAERADKIKMAKILFEHKIDGNVKDKDGTPAIIHAVKNGRKDFVELLIENKVDINAKDKDNLTALHWAVNICNANLVTILMAAKANLTAKANVSMNLNRDSTAPLTYVDTTRVDDKYWDCVKAIVDDCLANQSPEDKEDLAGFGWVLIFSASKKKFEITRKFLMANTNPNCSIEEGGKKNYLLDYLVRGLDEAVKEEAKKDIYEPQNWKKEDIRNWKKIDEFVALIKLAFQKGFDPNLMDKESALSLAQTQECMAVLLKYSSGKDMESDPLDFIKYIHHAKQACIEYWEKSLRMRSEDSKTFIASLQKYIHDNKVLEQPTREAQRAIKSIIKTYVGTLRNPNSREAFKKLKANGLITSDMLPQQQTNSKISEAEEDDTESTMGDAESLAPAQAPDTRASVSQSSSSSSTSFSSYSPSSSTSSSSAAVTSSPATPSAASSLRGPSSLFSGSGSGSGSKTKPNGRGNRMQTEEAREMMPINGNSQTTTSAQGLAMFDESSKARTESPSSTTPSK